MAGARPTESRQELSRGVGVVDVHLRVRQGRAHGLSRAELSRARRPRVRRHDRAASSPSSRRARLDQRHLQGRGTRRQSAARRDVRVLRERAGRRRTTTRASARSFSPRTSSGDERSRLSSRSPDKRALVTGASRGLGRAMAIALAEAGADVVCASSKPDGATDTADCDSRARPQGVDGRTPISPIATRSTRWRPTSSATGRRDRHSRQQRRLRSRATRPSSFRSTSGIACCARISTPCCSSASTLARR